MTFPTRLDQAILVTATGSLLFCTAVNCYTYRIAYPLWRWVGKADFLPLHREYMRRLGPVITLPHVVAFFSSAALLARRPAWLPRADDAAIFAACSVVILLSIFVAGPVHGRFDRAGSIDDAGMVRLQRVSLVRSLLLLVASLLLLFKMASALSS